MLLPVGVGSGTKQTPRITLFLVLLNTAIYLLCVSAGWRQNGFSFDGLAEPPAEVVARWALNASHLSPLSLLTAPWIHLDILHLAGNLLFLWVFGAAVEESLGPSAMLGIYLAGGICSIGMQLVACWLGLAIGDISYAGASGAVIALIIALALSRYRARVRIWLVLAELDLPIWLTLAAFAGWYGLVPLSGSAPGSLSSYWGHLGGCIAGVAAALVLRLPSRSHLGYAVDDAVRRIESGKLEEGLKKLLALQRTSPDEFRISLTLARSYVKVWDRPAAARCFGQAIAQCLKENNTSTALIAWNEAVAANAALAPTAALSLAIALSRCGEKAEAANICEWILSTDPQIADTATIERARLLLSQCTPP